MSTPTPEPQRVVLVTGAAYGIGQSIALRLLDDGWTVAAAAEVDPEVAVAAGERVGRPVLALREDFSDPTRAGHCVEETVRHFGRIDALVNNAGITLTKPLEETAIEEIQQLVSVNLISPLLAMQAAFPHMRANGGGSIVNLASIHATRSRAGFAAYAATKGGVEALTQQLAVEGSPTIRVNAVAPGLIRVERQEGVGLDPISRHIPAGRPGQTREVAAAVAWLLDAEYVTGAILPVDGGLGVSLPRFDLR